MIYELRRYTLVPGGIREYLATYAEKGRAVQTRILGDLVVLMQPETGDLNQLVFLWRYESFEDRRARRQALMEDAQFADFRKAVRHLVVAQENQLLTAA